MNKNAIKKYAIWARKELIERISQRAMIYGITPKDVGNPDADSVHGYLLSQTEKKQRQALIRNIQAKGYTQVMEEVAYTWFNRFAALRFMEVNGYLPSHVRVFTNDAGEFKPQILAEAIHLELDGLDMKKVYALENENQREELFKYLLIVQCNALNSILPGMFQRIDDYTELLLPDYLLREGSAVEQLVTTIPEEDWTDQVQIIGWLYQYYNTEPKDKVFADLKKNIKITKENIPAATQLFTPDWIVHYMVENSLGRLWLEGHPTAKSKFLPEHNADGSVRVEGGKWNYYLEEAEQEPEVQAQLAEIRKEYAALKPEEIRVIDPCCGSGHILCVLFDVLVQIYEDCGYTAREAAGKIVENNLWGLDIDERAAQLSYFAVMMKARQYDRRFFSRKVQPHVYAIEESNGITSAPMHDIDLNLTQKEYDEAVRQVLRLVEEMHNAKEYGSIIHVTACDWELLRRFAVPREENGQLRLDVYGEVATFERLQRLITIGEILAQKYDVVVTNPPYRGIGDVAENLSEYVKRNYPLSKQDLSTVFMERCNSFCKKHGLYSMINIPVWMLLTSFSDLRNKIYESSTIVNLAHIGRGVFGSDFGTVSFTIFAESIGSYRGIYKRLFDRAGDVEPEEKKLERFFSNENTYISGSASFKRIPGERLAYWASSQNAQAYIDNKPLFYFADVKKGMSTADDQRFLRLWHEVSTSNFACFTEENPKWYRLNKGGSFRRWYGNNEYVVDWFNNGSSIKSFKKAVIRNEPFYFRPIGLTWTYVTNYKLNVRYYEKAAFAAGGPGIFPKSIEWQYILGFLNTKVAQLFANNVGGESITYEVGEVASIPIAVLSEADKTIVKKIVEECVRISKEDWDSTESSWDFQQHPLVTLKGGAGYADMPIESWSDTIESAFHSWQAETDARFTQLKANEEELNRIFIDIYGLQNELTPEVEDKDVTVRKADLQREIKSLISYAVGCMFGRYSLDRDVLVFAGGEFSDQWLVVNPDRSQKLDAHKSLCYLRDVAQNAEIADLVHSHFGVDADNVIPVTDDEYFEDDIVSRFVKFLEIAYGKDTLEANLTFIANALGGKGSSREVIRKYFLNDFFEDHVKIYQKRPIYWLFDSGKKNGFKCLIYMHRYQPDTIARIRTDYVHEQQSRYRTAIADLEQRINGASTGERVKLNKKLTKLQDQATELRLYEEKIHHLADQMIAIDLDDGVKVNYAKFQDVLAKVK